MVKFKRRKAKLSEYIPKGFKIGRSYVDFAFMKENEEISSWWEMDTIIGKIGGKSILTFCFIPYNFMFGLLLDNNNAVEVTRNIVALKTRLSHSDKSLGDFFKVLLTDNGV